MDARRKTTHTVLCDRPNQLENYYNDSAQSCNQEAKARERTNVVSQ
jgi:hypothetical protein